MNKILEVIVSFNNIKRQIKIMQIRYESNEVYRIAKSEQYKSDDEILNFTCTAENGVKVITLHYYPNESRWESGIEINYVDKQKDEQ